MFKTVKNLKLRINEEKKICLEKLGGEINNISSLFSVEQEKYLDKFGKIESILEISMIKLMNLIIFFE
jgi:hypothetical protein